MKYHDSKKYTRHAWLISLYRNQCEKHSCPVSQVNVILDKNVSRIGFDSEISTTHDECTFLNRDISSPARGDTIEADGVSQIFVSEIDNDGIISSWLVKNG